MEFCKQLYEYDMFGYSAGLYLNGNTKKGTLFGLIMSIIYIITFIGVSIYYINEILSKNNYTFSSSTTEHENVASVILDKD